jgi:hypothetical protein
VQIYNVATLKFMAQLILPTHVGRIVHAEASNECTSFYSKFNHKNKGVNKIVQPSFVRPLT